MTTEQIYQIFKAKQGKKTEIKNAATMKGPKDLEAVVRLLSKQH